LIAVRESGEKWLDQQGNDQLDAMIASTSGFLIGLYDRSGEWRDSPGWHGSQSSHEVTPFGSLTLLAYSTLLKSAELEPARVHLPPEMLSDISVRLSNLATERGQFSTDEDHFEANFVDLDGQEKIGTYTYHEAWFPNAVACAAAWLRHLQLANASHAEVVSARRVLGKLILEHAEEVTTGRKDFYSADNLLRLDLIKPR
jgi:hypothetical protein